jgi:murein DD-endopeptidase MepM/ murein hydrolase activator NlpD
LKVSKQKDGQADESLVTLLSPSEGFIAVTAQASVSAQTIRSPRVERESLPYELKIQEKLAQVQALVAFVEQEHFTLSTVYAYLQQEKRAVLAVRNIARILGYELDEYIGETHQLLSESEASDLYQFTEAFAPPLFDIINSIGPNRDYISDMRTHVEELQYATEARQALLQYLLISYNARYQRANLFGNLMEASKWTAMYSRNLDTADEIIHQTRGLLVAQKNAVRDYLNFITQEIREIADLAEARYRVVKPIAYMQTIEAAENRIIHILGERSQAYETLNLSALTPQQRSSRFSGLAKHVIRRAPKLAIFLMGLAAAGGGLFAFLRPQTAPATAATVPEPIRGTADSNDTARFTTLNTGNFTARSAQMLQDIAATLTGSQSQTATVAAPAPVVTAEAQKITDFFATLSPTSGKHTLVIENANELGAFIAYLQSHNYYSEADVLSLFNLSSATEFTHSLVVDVRHGTVKPMLFPYNEANSNLTAPMTVLPGANPIGTGLVSLVTAAFSDVNANTAPMATLQPDEAFIVYRVQGGDTLEAIANRYGTTVTQIQADNILNTDAINRGQTLQIRRPATTTDNRTAPFSISLWNTGTTKNRTAMGVVPKLTSISNEIVSRYYTQLFPSLDAMPTDARNYVVATVDEVASFFNVRPQDVLGILKQEQNNAGFRLYEDRVSSAGAVGVAQIIPQTWNGWKGSNGASFASSMADIERDGGIGFDWAARETWRMVQQGIMPASALANTNADPTVFENAIAGVARHLSQYGVTSQLAEQDPAQYEQRLADAIAIYNSGRPLSESSDFVQSAENHSTTGAYVAQAMETSNEVAGAFQQVATTAPVTSASLTPTVALEQRYSTKFREMFDEDFGIQLSDAELAGFLAANQTLLDDVRLGKVDPMLAGAQLIEQVELHYMREGREAIRNGDVRPWPYIHNTETLEAQRLAVTLMGRTLTLNEIDQLVVANNADVNAMRTVLAGRAESKLFIQAQQSFDQMLQRSARGLNLYNYEVAAIVHPLLSGINLNGLDDTALRTMTAQVQSAIRALPEYQDLYGAREFKAMPFLPMPEVFKGFGVAVSYQAGGYHTGIDITAPAENGQEPAIFAVDTGTVVHVGSLYCAQPDACRGGKAIVIDHGNNLYTLYSHNSEADVEVGQRVEAGQQIGRQGNEGYSFGSHLHFEVHTGAPWSGDWEKPFEGGSFVDPMEYLPR